MSNAHSDKHSASLPKCAYLCFAWGESDLPAAIVATTRAAVLQFFVDEWFGEQPDEMHGSNREQFDEVVARFDAHDWREEGPLEWTFEIGGVEITKVNAPSAPSSTAKPLEGATPRVEANLRGSGLHPTCPFAEFARQLERELAEAQRTIAGLAAAGQTALTCLDAAHEVARPSQLAPINHRRQDDPVAQFRTHQRSAPVSSAAAPERPRVSVLLANWGGTAVGLDKLKELAYGLESDLAALRAAPQSATRQRGSVPELRVLANALAAMKPEWGIGEESTKAWKQFVNDFQSGKVTITPVSAPAEELRTFPMQDGPAIPWKLAEAIWVGYSLCGGGSQPLEQVAKRGGFGWEEVALIWRNDNARGAIKRAVDAFSGPHSP